MTLYPVNDTAIYNQSQRKTLARALNMSQGSFSLLLVRCNYVSLRKHLVADLKQESSLPIQEVTLPPDSQTLYGTIKAELGEQSPSVLMIYGLESVIAIDQVLHAANLAREAFRNFPCPLVLWINDQLWKKLNRKAPDFTSWATTYEFVLSPDELVNFLEEKAQHLFNCVLDNGAERFIANEIILGLESSSELQSAYQELKQRGITINPALEARLKWVYGRSFYTHQQIPLALQQFQQSLRYWQQNRQPDPEENSPSQLPSSDLPLLWQGVLFFQMGLGWCYLAQQHRHRNGQQEWRQARDYFQQCIEKFEAAQRPDLVAKFINKLGEVLRQLQDWSALWTLALKSRQLHQELGESAQTQMAQDYVFLADVELQRAHWENAKELALVALEILALVGRRNPENPVLAHQQSFALSLLAQALEKQGLTADAIHQLELATKTIQTTLLTVDLIRLYLQILERLRRLYFQLGEYKEAFKIREEYRNQSSAYGYNAFVGAGRLQPRKQVMTSNIDPSAANITFTDEITASGREEAIHQLLKRMASTYYKLTVVYGQSGVGKSSILRAGLIPALQRKSIDARIVTPIVIKTYNSFASELEQKLLNQELETPPASPPLASDSDFTYQEQVEPESQTLAEKLKTILEKLQDNSNQNLLTVLIFDQFEELFFIQSPALQRHFFEFLKNCLNIPFVKVVISLREDYLHYLLEGSRTVALDAINNDILSKDILFYLGNFSEEEAYNVIKSLTNRAHFYLEDALIQALVKDLAGDSGEVRPIELQVVGSQLQTENITTLQEYQDKGPKQKLVERFLEQVIRDCGPENEKAARIVLYSLTDENDTRPLKTRTELAEELKKKLNPTNALIPLDLILYILEKSGLVYRENSITGELYQLVHDYLAGFIRRQNRTEQEEAIAKLQEENAQLLKEKEMSDKLAEAQEKRRKAEEKIRNLERLGVALGVGLVASLAFVFYTNGQEEVKARIQALTSAKDALLLADQQDQLGVLQTTVQIGYNTLETQASEPVKQEIAQGLMQMISGIQEQNRFEGHQGSVLAVSVSPDGQRIASASSDKTVKIWSKEGTLIADLVHPTTVKSVRYSPDGKIIATTTANITIPDQNRVSLWTENGTPLEHKPMQHREIVNSVSFSPNGQLLVTASNDKTLKLWKLDGTLLKIFRGHRDRVFDAEFSPDGQMIASASKDGTVKLWRVNGQLIRTLTGHNRPVYDIDFNPNGEIIASASGDRTIKFWKAQTGQELKTPFKGHNEDVLSLNFSPDGKLLMTGSRDNTVKLWNLRGSVLKTFTGHRDSIWGVEFSPDNQTLLSGSADGTVRLWDRNRDPLNTTLQGHTAQVWSVNFSPDGETLATASEDTTVQLWNREGRFQNITLAHPSKVNWVSFNPDGSELATASEDKIVRLWTKAGQLLRSFSGHTQAVKVVTFSPDDQFLASASEDKTVKLWNKQGQLIATLPHDHVVWDVRWSPDGKTLATATGLLPAQSEPPNNPQYSVTLWSQQGQTWQRQLELPAAETVKTLSFLGNSQQLAVASEDTVTLWNLQFPQPQASCPLVHNATVQSLSFHAEQGILATASDDKKVRLWQVNKSLWNTFNCNPVTPLVTLEQNEFINSVSFSRGEPPILAIAKDNGLVILWSLKNLNLNHQVTRSCDWLQDYLTTNPSHLDDPDRELCNQTE